VARNRKRAKERRPRRPPQAGSRPGSPGDRSNVPGVLPGLPTVTHDVGPELEPEENGAPDPLEHAMPDVEFAEAQLAAGRPIESEPDDEADEEEFEREVEESIEQADRGGGGGRFGRGGRGGREDSGGGSLEPAASGALPAEHRPGMFQRLTGFLQGCWRELQRVQWPDRPQVIQATGVVIGFVIIAAAFLGLADFVAGKLVTFILQ